MSESPRFRSVVFAAIAAAVLLFCNGAGFGQQHPRSKVGLKLEKMELEDTFGNKISIEDYRGSVVVILGGTTW